MMSHSSIAKTHDKLDNRDILIDFSNKDLLSSKKFSDDSSSSSLLSDSSSSASDVSLQHVPHRRAVKSCFWSTIIFSINFMSSILVINLSKW